MPGLTDASADTAPGPDRRHRLATTSETDPRFQSDAERLDWATTSLLREEPRFSAANPPLAWQKLILPALLLLLACSFAPKTAGPATVLLSIGVLAPFLCATALRVAALTIASRPRSNQPSTRTAEPFAPLPRYSVLVPLFRETEILNDLLAALAQIDYPPAELEILLVIEACDAEMQEALHHVSLPANIHVIVTPDGEPRTKPKALNYALTFATGEFVVVFDAEDIPEPDQLHRAVAMFEANPGLACVQAQLNIYNARESWLTRQFAIEYTTLFDCILPTLERLGIPIPLGGTSNHFRRSALEKAGAWDPFNVTEDADLGIRLARLGFSVRTLQSTTWEEAPPNWRIWLGQRTRWLKGWLQTYLVHTRSPSETWRDLGLWQFAGVNLLMIGVLLSALAHPWAYALIAMNLAYISAGAVQPNPVLDWFFWAGLANLLMAYLTGVALAIMALRRRGMADLTIAALQVPVYWILISIAAYRALFELARWPFFWEKTAHRRRRGPAAPPRS